VGSVDSPQRVLSGMRANGRLHLGHYHGVIKNWLKLQHEYECFFFVADWHAMMTHFEASEHIEQFVWDMVVDWLAAGIDPGSATLFVQSKVPEHAELHLLLSMTTPISWLERLPSYKEIQDKTSSASPAEYGTYGFLGYPLLQAADMLVYRAGAIPVGLDQAPHLEMTRDVARRFNHVFGKEQKFEVNVELAIKRMGRKAAALYRSLRKRFTEHGDQDALETARALIRDQANITVADKERLFGYLEGSAKVILPEPQALLMPISKMPGLDGNKMSKSGQNAIYLRDDADTIAKKIKNMRTDPARVRLTDAGDPEQCPVWTMHQVYSDDRIQNWVQTGCRNAGIGCLECKQPIADAIIAELEPIRLKAEKYESDPDMIRSIIQEGSEHARDSARETMEEVRVAMGLDYR
jgi:tryptophanyl-tRNA synthetase